MFVVLSGIVGRWVLMLVHVLGRFVVTVLVNVSVRVRMAVMRAIGVRMLMLVLVLVLVGVTGHADLRYLVS